MIDPYDNRWHEAKRDHAAAVRREEEGDDWDWSDEEILDDEDADNDPMLDLRPVPGPRP